MTTANAHADGRPGGTFAAEGERAADKLFGGRLAVDTFTPLPRPVGAALQEKYKYDARDRLRSFEERETEGVSKDRRTVDVFYVDEWALVRSSLAHQIPAVGWQVANWAPQYALVAHPIAEALVAELHSRGFQVIEREESAERDAVEAK